MAIHVEIISREMIKPSSPTPPHLKTLRLSFLDQISPPVYIPLIFFYHHDQLSHINVGNQVELSRFLRRSLSDVLTIFYPLVGKIQENSSIVDCGDCGAEFIEALVHARLLDVMIEDPNMEDIKKLQPLDPLGEGEKVVLAVKISFFDCGGIAVALCLSHKVGDGMSLATFVNAWAAASRGEAEKPQPTFDLASIFPPRSMSNALGQTHRVGMTNEKLVTKRFVFNKEKIDNIKECFASESQVKEPTRVEAVSACIWRRSMAVAKAKARSESLSFVAVHAVNLRARANRPFPENMWGNCWRPVFTLSKPNDDSDLVASLRSAIRSIDGDFVNRIQNGEYLNHLSRKVDLYSNGGLEFCNFSSWCRFPLYEVDFGWGKPDWVCTTTLPYKNVVILMSSPCGEGIEAWVNMLEDDMKIFEQDQEAW